MLKSKKINVLITNLKGGVGKTTCTILLATVARQAGLKVVVIDNDPQASSTYFFAYGHPDQKKALAQVHQANLFTFLKGESSLEQSLLDCNGIRLLGTTKDYIHAREYFYGGQEHANTLKKALATLDYDLALIDSPGNIPELLNLGLSLAHTVIIPTDASMLSIELLPVTLGHIEAAKQSKLAQHLKRTLILPNRVKPREQISKETLSFLNSSKNPYKAFFLKKGRELLTIEEKAEIAKFTTMGILLSKRSPTLAKFNFLLKEVYA